MGAMSRVLLWSWHQIRDGWSPAGGEAYRPDLGPYGDKPEYMKARARLQADLGWNGLVWCHTTLDDALDWGETNARFSRELREQVWEFLVPENRVVWIYTFIWERILGYRTYTRTVEVEGAEAKAIFDSDLPTEPEELWETLRCSQKAVSGPAFSDRTALLPFPVPEEWLTHSAPITVAEFRDRHARR